MRKILLLSLAVLPLISNSVFSTEVDSEPTGDIQQSLKSIVGRELGYLKESGIAEIMPFNASLTSTKTGFHIAIPIFPIMFRGDDAQGGMNIFEFFNNLQNNPKLLFQQNGSPESQWVQRTKVVTNPEAIQEIGMLMKQDIKGIVKVLEKIAELKIIPGDVLLNAIMSVGIRLNFDGTCEVVVPKATQSMVGLILKICDTIHKYEDEMKANDGKIWASFGEVSETDKDAVRAVIYECADLQKSKQALEKQIQEQKSNEQELESLQRKLAESEAAKQAQEAKKSELTAEIAVLKRQIEEIGAISSEFESASKALPGTLPTSTPNFKNATNPFMTIALKLPEDMKAPYTGLDADINSLPSNNTVATRRLRTEIWEKLKSAVATTQQEISKKREELNIKIAQSEKALEEEAPVVGLTQEEQDKMEDLQSKIESLKGQMDEIQERMNAMKTEWGDRYPDIKVAARVVQRQPEIKPIDKRIQELNLEDELRRIKGEAIAAVEELQKRAYGGQETVSTKATAPSPQTDADATPPVKAEK